MLIMKSPLIMTNKYFQFTSIVSSKHLPVSGQLQRYLINITQKAQTKTTSSTSICWACYKITKYLLRVNIFWLLHTVCWLCQNGVHK